MITVEALELKWSRRDRDSLGTTLHDQKIGLQVYPTDLTLVGVDWVIRDAVEGDAEQVALVHIASWQAGYRGQMPDAYLDELSDHMDQRVESWRRKIVGSDPGVAGMTMLVAEDTGGSLLGFAVFGPPRDPQSTIGTGELWAMYTRPAAWGTGVARCLLTTAASELASVYDSAFLWVLDTNARARAFYAKHGWRPDGTEIIDKSRGFALRELRYVTTLADTDTRHQ